MLSYLDHVVMYSISGQYSLHIIEKDVLFQYDSTRSLSGDCFQAYCPIILVHPLLIPSLLY